MLIVFLFSFCQSTKRICICAKHCHYTCPIDSFVAMNSELQFNDYILSQIKDEKEIEIDFYSKLNEFSFYLDLELFGESKVTIIALLDSQTIKLNIKEKSQTFYKTVEIEPNYQIILPNLIPFRQNFIDQRKNLLDSGPESTPVPISVGISQMHIIGAIGCSPDLTQDPNSGCDTSLFSYHCGYRCWMNSGEGLFYYSFKGVKFQIYGTIDPNHGKFDIEIDGTIVQEIDEYTTARQKWALLYTSNLLEYKEHVVKCIGKGDCFELYKLSYWPSLKSRRLNSTDFFKVAGEWMKETDAIGGYREYSHGDSIATVEIKCSKFWLYGLKDENLGNVNITFGDIDEQIDQYSYNRIEGCLVYESDLLP